MKPDMEELNKSGIVITLFSTASAVGKTLLSINMGAELARTGFRVCVVDLDLQYGDICNFLHIEPTKTIFDAQQAIQNRDEEFQIEEYLTTYRHELGEFSVLAAPLKIEEAYNISTAAVTAMMAQLRLRYDYIILDTTAAFSELNLAVMDFSTIITFLGIVDFIPTIKNMKVGYDTMRSIGYDKDKIRLVLNRSNSKTRIELQDVEQLLEETFYHILPNDFLTASQSIHQGIPLIFDQEDTELAEGLEDLVARYTNRIPLQDRSTRRRSSWVSRLFK